MAKAPQTNPAIVKKLIENLQGDLRSLSSECKRKYPPVKESAEAGILKLRNVMAKPDQEIIPGLVACSVEVIQPFLLGCDTKNAKIVHQCLISIQRLISHEAMSLSAANNVINVLWSLMEAGVEELKLLQTATLLINSNWVVQHDSLAKALVLCFRLYFTKDSTTINTAAATVRQLVSVVFERVVAEDSGPPAEALEEMNFEALKAGGKHPPKSLRPCAKDAYLLFQDLCQLVNADQPYWLIGMTEMTRTFGLELMESLLTGFPQIFLQHPEFSFLLKERVCPLIIKLFSPSVKYRPGGPAPPSPSLVDKPYFPIVMRLLRIIHVLIQNYYSLLVTECEIFLSLLVKFLDPEKPTWQRALALEVLEKLLGQSHLVKQFCLCYDMKDHSTKILRDIVNGIGSFVQSQFIMPPSSQTSHQTGVKAQDVQGQPPSLVGGMPVGSGITPQAAFYYRGVWIPLVVNITASHGSTKAVFLEMIDKVDAPPIPDGYSMSLAFLCLLHVVKCVQNLIEGTTDPVLPPAESSGGETAATSEEKSFNVQLVDSSWCGILAAFSLLLDASTDETATEAILKSEQIYASLCGRLKMTIPRDAFITALCKASLPPHYTLTVLSNTQTPSHGLSRMPSGGSGVSSQDSVQGNYELIQGSQVVAVGTPLPTTSHPIGVQQGPVMLTAKNIQCMRAVLSVAHCHGAILGSAWHMILTTLQHLVWILGLKPSTGGSLRATQLASESANAVLTTAVMADLPVLSAMLSRLFESSQYLDEVALHHLIDALCKLSAEAMELAYSNREPSLFAVAKLLETGLVNLPRVEVLWKPVTAHLLEVCQHPHTSMRSWGAESITALIKSALVYKYEPPLHDNMKLQTMILTPLQELSGIMHHDIRQKQLECVLQILHQNGETLAQGWPLVLGVIGAVSNDQGETLIRTAFQSLQLVVTDFLPIMPCQCLEVCIEVASRFGLQNQELNISLTAIGLLWNISDYLYQNRTKIADDLGQEMKSKSDNSSDRNTLPPFDKLWMCVYSKLGELCVDPRPAVRKSAGQTLFSTVAAHGTLIQHSTWHTVLWQVLFPLLDKVKSASSTASHSREEANAGNILIHHSRDTAEKQWAETRVLTLAGVARVFNTKRDLLQSLGDFPRAWALLLEFIELSALCRNAEVSLAALKSFQEILQINKDSDQGKEEWMLFERKEPVSDPPSEERVPHETAPITVAPTSDVVSASPSKPLDDTALWSSAWKVWLSIGTTATMPPDSNQGGLYIPAQPFLTALVQIFPALFEHIKTRFVASDLQKLSAVLQRALAVPVHGDSTPFILPTGEVGLTPLQEAILCAIQVLIKEVVTGSDTMPSMYADLFNQLLAFIEYGVKPPKFGKVDAKSITTISKAGQADWVAMNYVPFAERMVELMVELYKSTASHPVVIKQSVLQNIVKTLRLPLGLKYGCPSPTTWMLVIDAFLDILTVGLPIARKHPEDFKGMWAELANTLDEFLFTKHPPPATLSVEEYQRDEAIDCKVVGVIRDEILPYSRHMPEEFVIHIMKVLNKGSIHSATSSAFIDPDASRKLREEFAKSCFETLLQFSFITKTSGADSGEGAISKLAVTSLLTRCQEVLSKFVEDERLSGRCPLPRARMSEISFVLKAISTLLTSLKRAPPSNVETKIWQQVIDLYPSLVDCTTSTSPQVCKALRDALSQYRDLLSPPSYAINGR